MVKPKNEVSILVVEDEKFDETATRGLLASAGYTCVECAGSAEAAHAALTQREFDIVVVDLRIPEKQGEDPDQSHGLDLIDDIKVLKIPQIVLSFWATTNWVIPVLARSIGHLCKSDIKASAFLDHAIQTTLGGGVVYSSTPLAMIQSLTTKTNKRSDISQLSHREKQVTYLYAFKFHGGEKSDEKVAQTLVIQPDTAAKHRKNAMEKLNIHSAAELVSWAHRNLHEFDDVKGLFAGVPESE